MSQDKDLEKELERLKKSMNDISNVSDIFKEQTTSDDAESPEESKFRDEYFSKVKLEIEGDNILDDLKNQDAIVLDEIQMHIKAINALAVKHKRQVFCYLSLEKGNHNKDEQLGMLMCLGKKSFVKVSIASFTDCLIEQYDADTFIEWISFSNKVGIGSVIERPGKKDEYPDDSDEE